MGMNGGRQRDERAAYKKALKRKTRYKVPKFSGGLAVIITVFSLIIIVCGIIIMRGDHLPKDPESDRTTLLTDVTGNDTSDAPSGMVLVTLTEKEVTRGNLILVNSDYEYVFPDVREDVSVYENKTISYKVNDKNVTMSPVTITAFNRLMDDFYAVTQCRDVMVVSGFRTEEFQRKLYNDRVATDGVELAAKYVALPGQSEHHTGLAMDLSVYTDAGEGFYLRDYERCRWLVENFEKYGFVLRYPEEKANITGISYESWHYRYVGLPHSLIMKDMGLCFEEYIEYVKGLSDGKALCYREDMKADSSEASVSTVDVEDFAEYPEGYLVYYAEMTAEETVVSVPADREYLISGDNTGGFVVTVMPQQNRN